MTSCVDCCLAISAFSQTFVLLLSVHLLCHILLLIQ